MILTPRKKLITSKRLQRGNFVLTILEGQDPFFNEVIFLNGWENQVGESFAPQIGPVMNWSILSGSQPSQVDGEVSAVRAKYGTRSIYWKESIGVANAGWATDFKQAGSVFGFAGDFTIECDIYIENQNSQIDIIGLWDFGERQWRWFLESGNGRMGFGVSTTGVNELFALSQEAWGGGIDGVKGGAWHHIAVCRNGDDWYGWLDGVLPDGGVNTGPATLFLPTDAYLVIGQIGFQDGSGNVEAYIDNLRITDGTARYIAPFTPPTEAHPDF